MEDKYYATSAESIQKAFKEGHPVSYARVFVVN